MRGTKKNHNSPFFWAVREREEEMRERLQVLSMIYRDRVVGIRRIKNESLSTRRGLRMSTKKKEGFH